MKLTNQRSANDQEVALQKLKDKNQQVISLQNEVLRLTAEKEALKSQVNLEGKINQHAVGTINTEYFKITRKPIMTRNSMRLTV